MSLVKIFEEVVNIEICSYLWAGGEFALCLVLEVGICLHLSTREKKKKNLISVFIIVTLNISCLSQMKFEVSLTTKLT